MQYENTPLHTQTEKRTIPKRVFLWMPVILASFVVFALLYVLSLNDPPKNFNTAEPISVEEGATVRDVANLLEESDMIRSSLYVYILFQTKFNGSYVRAGNYQFSEPLSSDEIIWALTSGTYRTPATIVTFPEGFRVSQIPMFFPEDFDTTSTVSLEALEGYLFPDTYFLDENETMDDVITRMQSNFDQKIQLVAEEIEDSPYTLEEVIIIASILEREANDDESMRTVAGIIENRLDANMPLQVDATLEYVLGRGSDELTLDDLDLDSPYNTYEYKGLPPTPIANPGLAAIRAVLNPIYTEYLYYLTGRDGHFYYAQTFEEHVENKSSYLW